MYTHIYTHTYIYGLPKWLSSKESASKAGNTGLILGGKDPLEEGKATHSSILSWRSLARDRGAWQDNP